MSMTVTQNHRFSAAKQSGFVSIIVTMIIMVLLSLIVIGFAKISRREQRQGLDRQLLSQAQYAAESGINDAQAFLQRPTRTISATANTTCNSYDGDATGVVEPKSGSTNGLPKPSTISDNAVVSCVLVDANATNLLYGDVSTSSEVIIPLKLAAGANITTIAISWQSGSSSSDYSMCQTDPAVSLSKDTAWNCPAGVLRADVVPTSTLTRAALVAADKGLLLVPQTDATPSSAINFSAAPLATTSAMVKGIACKSSAPAPFACTATLTVPSSTGYYLRIRPVYKPATISVAANSGAKLVGAQAIVDSTARANDVLKRLVARVPTCTSGQLCGVHPAGFALQSADTICKRYTLIPSNNELNGTSEDPSCSLP